MAPDTPLTALSPEIPALQGPRILLRALTENDADSLHRLAGQQKVYRYLPTFLFEQKYADPHEVIRLLYSECLQESLILGIFMEGHFCGLAEMYGYRAPIHKISVGYRLSQEYWGRGVATEALGAMTDFLLEDTSVEIITASTMVENRASANVLRKNSYRLVVRNVPEDWGYTEPTPADKWIR